MPPFQTIRPFACSVPVSVNVSVVFGEVVGAVAVMMKVSPAAAAPVLAGAVPVNAIPTISEPAVTSAGIPLVSSSQLPAAVKPNV